LGRDSSAAIREITLLEPNWLTAAIYRVLEMAKSNECDGELSRANLSQWLDPNIYPSRWHEFILTMMQDPEIGLCFRLPDQGEGRYRIPEALPPGAPDRRRWPEEPLRFRYRYGFLPTGLIPRFIVQSHRNLTGRRSRWKQGVELAAAGCDMLIITDLEDRRVDIEVAGSPPCGALR
jgi:internalin A